MPKRRKLIKEERQRIYEKTNGRCAYCGCEIKPQEMVVDHIKAHIHGGTCDESNLFPACRPCNHRKGTSSLSSFRKQLGMSADVLMRDSVTFRNAVRYGLVKLNPHEIKFYFEEKSL